MDYACKHALCPFYKRHSVNDAEIVCEGIAKSAKETVLVFSGRDKAVRFFREYCCRAYEVCPVAKGCFEKYE